MNSRFAALLALALCIYVAPRAAAGRALGDCDTATVGVDLSLTSTVVDGIFQKAVGQSFTATDTLISSVTAWRIYGQDSTAWPAKFWITRMRADGYPDTDPVTGILYEGPPTVFPYGDGVHHVELRVEFNPPFALPGPGTPSSTSPAASS